MMEVWIDASGFPSHEVSSWGRIRNKKTGHILKPNLDRYGYPRLSLGSVDNVPVHRVVCTSLYGEPSPDKNQVNHVDGNRANNHVFNLEWCSPSENIKWGVRSRRIDPSIGMEKARLVNQKQVRIVENDRVFDSVKDCAEYLGVRPTNVSRCLVGQRAGQKLHGYTLEFVGRGRSEQ